MSVAAPERPPASEAQAPQDLAHATLTPWRIDRGSLRHALSRIERGLAAASVTGAALYVATVAAGRSAPFWPSFPWLAWFAGTVAVLAVLWWLGARSVPGPLGRRWHAAGWPMLALLPAAAAGVALYFDDRANHLVLFGATTRIELSAYLAILFVVGQLAFWLTAAARSWQSDRRLTSGTLPPLVLGVAVAAYLHASVFQRWPLYQLDLHTNLAAARTLLSGAVPYATDLPAWSGRTHDLPVILAFFYAPLSLLTALVSSLAFFLANQACLLLAMWLIARWFAPPSQRLWWLASILALSTTFWPWQEAITFGRPAGLVALLLAASITASGPRRDAIGGAALGVALLFEPFLPWLLVPFLVHRRWRAIASAALTATTLVVASLPVATWQAWRTYLIGGLPELLSGSVRGTDVTLAALHARIFVGREVLGSPGPAPAYAAIVALNLGAVALALLGVAFLHTRPRSVDPADTRRRWLLDSVLGPTLALLLAPVAWQHDTSLLVLAFLVLALPPVWKPLAPAARAAVAALATTGVFLVGLHDEQLLHLLEPVVDRWPVALSVYPIGLLCLAAASLIARIAAPAAVSPVADIRGTGRLLAPGATALAMFSALGGAALVATIVAGRTSLFFPTLRWLAAFAASFSVVIALWFAAARVHRGTAANRRTHAAWPTFALLPAGMAGAALYLDDTSNHFATRYTPTSQSLVVYAGLCLLIGHIAYWTMAALRRRPARLVSPSSAPPFALGLAAAAYVSANVFFPWIPRQTDLFVNLAGARAMLAGALPYNDALPIWENRIHHLPATLLFFFAPLAALGDPVARIAFFIGNQALWVLASWLFIRATVPATSRFFWLAGALVLGTTYLPWRESIRFGQQDGLLILLFTLAILLAGARRERAAGIALGVALVVKPLSIWFPLVFLLHGRWRTLLVAGLTAAALALISLPFTGWYPWWHFTTVELPAMLPGTVRGTNIPLPSLHARLFVLRPSLGDAEPAPQLFVISALNVAANLLGLLVLIHARLQEEPDRTRAWLLDAAIGLALTLVLAPMAWQHYASWLTIAFLVLALPRVWRPLEPPARLALGVLAGCGFMLLSLEDDRLLRLITPLVDQWPAAMSFYAPGLLCITGALVVARLAVSYRNTGT